MGQRQYSQAALYRAAIRDTRFSSGFGMYPPHVVKPRRWRPAAWLVFKFGFVGGLGLVVNVYIMYVLTQITALTGLLAGFLGGSSSLAFAIISSQAWVLAKFMMN